jgi:hypothetical protein
MLVHMSRGSPIVSFRSPVELLEQVKQVVARSAHTRRDGPWTLSGFIVSAIEEKLEKMARSAGKASPLPQAYRRDSSTFSSIVSDAKYKMDRLYTNEEREPMRSKKPRGSPVLSIRVPVELHEQMYQAVSRSAHTRRDGPWTLSSFIVSAIEEKLKKMARSAGKASPLPQAYRRDSSTF